MKQEIDIIISTCNRQHFLERTIHAFYHRLENPHLMNLIVIDDGSTDGTIEYLQELKEIGAIKTYVSKDFKHLCELYNMGFRDVTTELFIVTQDDMIIPKLEPDVVEQLVGLMNKYPEQGGIACRMQRIPNFHEEPGELTPARKNLSTCFRIQRRSDIQMVGGFGSRHWEERAFNANMTAIGKKTSWANHLWCNHIGFVPERGYNIKPKKWGTGIHSRIAEGREKGYPAIDPLTNIPFGR